MMPSHPPAQPARYDSTPALARTDHAPWRALRSPEAPQRSHTTCCCRVHTLLLSAPRTGCPSTCHRSLRMPTPTHNAMPPLPEHASTHTPAPSPPHPTSPIGPNPPPASPPLSGHAVTHVVTPCAAPPICQLPPAPTHADEDLQRDTDAGEHTGAQCPPPALPCTPADASHAPPAPTHAAADRQLDRPTSAPHATRRCHR